METRRHKIAFMSREIQDVMGNDIWKGVLARCRELDVSVVTLRGGFMGKELSTVLYYLADPAQYDGFVTWASSESNPAILQYYKQFDSVNLVGLTLQIPGHPCIAADSKRGMTELLEHLIVVHGYRKIAFVRGPAQHVYAKERFEAYQEILKKYDIAYDENLVSTPVEWNFEQGELAARELLETRGLKPGRDFQAIATVTDNISLGVISALKQKGYSVPSDVAVVGFNNTPEARSFTPPITSVAMPAFIQAQRGVDTVISMIQGKEIQQLAMLPATLMVGQSCGCMSNSVRKAISEIDAGAEDRDLTGPQRVIRCVSGKKKGKAEKVILEPGSELFKAALAGMTSSLRGDRSYSQVPVERILALVNTLFTGFYDEIFRNRTGEFLIALGKVLTESLTISERLDIWQNVLSDIRNSTLEEIQERVPAMMHVAGNLWHQARVQVSETTTRNRDAKFLQAMKTENLVRSVGVALITTYDIDKLMEVLTNSLGKLGIPSFYVALYEKPAFTLQNPVPPPYSRLILAKSDHGRQDLPADGLRFPTSEIVPERYLPSGRQYSLVVESLHFQDIMLGFIACETGPEDGVLYRSLRDQLGSAIYGAIVLNERARVKMIMENTLSTMSGKADIVSTHSAKISGGVTEISTSMEEVAASVREISVHIKTVMDTVTSASALVNAANTAIQDLTVSSQKIGEVVSMINDIAEKTNVLALNAAIEAARAGEAGRGFSVVAKEVKELAAQTVSATSQIQEIVGRNNTNTGATKETIERTRDAIKLIAELSASITAAINEQAKATSEISGLLIEASVGTTGISGAIKEIADLGENLKLD